MNEVRQRIVEEARKCLGTPFQHQGNLPGVGLDCTNFIGLTALNAGVEAVPEWANNYARRMDGQALLAILSEGLDYLEDYTDALPGDVLAFHDGRSPNIPRHLAILSEIRQQGVIYAIHATERGVREHRLDILWKKRIHSAWRLRGVNG